MTTIPLQQAIEQAKANPTSDFAKQLRSAIESGQLDQAAAKQGVDLTKYGRPAPQQNYLERVGGQFQKAGERVVSGIETGAKQIEQGNPLGAVRAGLRTVGSVAQAAVAPIVEAPGIKQGIEKVGETIAQAPIAQDVIQKITELSQKYPEAAKDVEDILNIATLGAGKVAEKPLRAGVEKAAQVAAESATTATKTVGQIVPKTKDAFLRFVSPEVDDVVKTSLKKTPTEKFDDFVKTAEEASMDATKPSVYEKVASQMENALQQQNDQIGSLSQQKNTIIQKAKTGLTDFSKETGQTILDINRALPDNALAKSFIERLKTVKTKIDADKIIDELQNDLYKGNKALTIPAGSTEDMILRRAIGEYNSKLKASLPSSYAKLNDEISKRIAIRDTLNTALGEVVDGVPVRGASLVKQFFSPAGTKTKQIFQAIKDTTGIDLAQDAILARYVGDAFGDVKVRSLLEGVPSTTTDALGRIVDFTFEKIGAKKALGEAKKKGILKRGRAITSPSSPK